MNGIQTIRMAFKSILNNKVKTPVGLHRGFLCRFLVWWLILTGWLPYLSPSSHLQMRC